MSRRVFVTTALGGLVSAGGALAAPPATSLRPVLRGNEFFKRAVPGARAIVEKANVSGAVAFAVADVTTGEPLEGMLASTGIPPASVAKAVTALYALDVLGSSHRFETRVMVTGGMRNGEVQGDLILVGGCDPTLDTDGLGEVAAELKAAGVRSVKGAFKVYEAALPRLRQIDPDQPDHVGYNPAVSGLALNHNRVHFEWRRADGDFTVTMDARSPKYRPDVATAVMRIVDRRAPVYTYTDGGVRDNWTVARGALGKGGARWLPVRKPGLYVGDVFATLAGAHGIRLKPAKLINTLPEGEIVVRHRSDDLRTILQGMLKYSTNLTAEMVGLAASAARVGTLRDLRHSAAEMNAWAVETLGMTSPALVDHSGLGDDSRLSANDMVKALVKAHGSGLRDILKPIALRDHKGRPDKSHPVTVDAKTGTLNFVSALAGYLSAGDGKEMAFAIFAADEDKRAKIPREARERPPGARGWNRRAKNMQQSLIERWGTLYSS